MFFAKNKKTQKRILANIKKNIALGVAYSNIIITFVIPKNIHYASFRN